MHKRDRAYRRWRANQRKAIAHKLINEKLEEDYSRYWCKSFTQLVYCEMTALEIFEKNREVFWEEQYIYPDFKNYTRMLLRYDLTRSEWIQEKIETKFLSRYKDWVKKVNPVTAEITYGWWQKFGFEGTETQQTSRDANYIKWVKSRHLKEDGKAAIIINDCGWDHRWYRNAESECCFAGDVIHINRQLDEMYQDWWEYFKSDQSVLDHQASLDWEGRDWSYLDQFDWDADNPNYQYNYPYSARMRYRRTPDRKGWIR